MAERLYRWVCANISYDHAKAESLKTDVFAMPSGAVAAFSGMTGVCFDKACLYVAMCRAVGVRVRLITGEGFNGREWIDHSWNQIYSDRDRRWVNVDPTFGDGDKSYFDRPNFDRDHRDGEIQGEW
jgi:transglutaminase-like putative cysteine protease